MRSYASAATTMEERTAVMANLSACQGVGFILGPRRLHFSLMGTVVSFNAFLSSSDSSFVRLHRLSGSCSSKLGKLTA